MIHYSTWLNPIEGTLTSGFGSRTNPVLNREEFHNGIDIAAGMGTSAVAVSDGEITETGTSTTYGKYIKYKVGNDYSVMYAHLSEIKVEKGEKVKRGQLIALTGDTGLVTGPHLHYTVFLSGEPINPLELDFVKFPND